MNREIDYWFPTLISKEKLEEFRDNSYLENKAYSLKGVLPNVSTQWNCDTYNTLELYNPVNDNDTIIHNFINLCKEKVHEFAKEFGVVKPLSDLQCNDFWFNIAKEGNYQECHQHPNSHFSIVYYVKTEKNCGNIVFKGPTAFSDMCTLPIDSKNLNRVSYPSCHYTPTNSLFLIFRSNLIHMVEKNRSGVDRISISMNFRYKD
jgi:uncharacterized protein (TIGR02466 family)